MNYIDNIEDKTKAVTRLFVYLCFIGVLIKIRVSLGLEMFTSLGWKVVFIWTISK